MQFFLFGIICFINKQKTYFFGAFTINLHKNFKFQERIRITKEYQKWPKTKHLKERPPNSTKKETKTATVILRPKCWAAASSLAVIQNVN